MDVSDGISLEDRELAEDLMRVWVRCEDSLVMRGDPGFAGFSVSVKEILLGLRMEWDVSHGYVFPWTDREKGPFPMTGFVAGEGGS
jgi:hypothetical protein